MNADNNHIIKEKLNEFIRRYYWQQIAHGLLGTFAISCALWLSFTSLAYFFYLSTDVRFFLMYSLIAVLGIFFSKDVILPSLKLLNVLKPLSDQQAAKIIGQHFKGDIDDKLLNAIYLLNEQGNNELILASIAQKSAKLKSYNFLSAIPVEQVKKALKIALVPTAVLLITLAVKPAVISTGTQRIVAYNTEFIAENPYQLKLLNSSLEGIRNEAFEVLIEYTGDEIPNDSYIEIEGQAHRLSQQNKGRFSHKISHLTGPVTFKIKSGIYLSRPFHIGVIDRPTLSGIQVEITEPRYLGGIKKKFKNNGNLSVPEGSKITWTINTSNCDSFLMIFGNNDSVLSNKSAFSIEKIAKVSQNYQLLLKNSDFKEDELYQYELTVIKDEYPTIKISEIQDSTHLKIRHINGYLSDDHGFSGLKFHYSIKDSNYVEAQSIDLGLNQQSFYKMVDFSSLKMKEGDNVAYYFEVIDNDGFNGKKSTFSSKMSFTMPGKSATDSIINKGNQQLKSLLANAQKESQALQEEYNEIKKILLEKKNLSWQEKEKLNDFLSHQKSFEENINKLQNANEQNNAQQESLTEKDKELLEKQEQINKLFDELMDEETKKLFDEIEKLMEEMNEEKREERLEEMNLNNENMEKSLDRALELFKQMEFEERLDESIKELDELSKKQKELAEETKNTPKKELEATKTKQEEIKKEFERLKEKIEDLKNKNDSLQNKHQLEDLKPEEQKTQEELDQAEQKLSKKQKKGASENQKGASDAMKKMSDKLAKTKQQMQNGNQEEDLNAMRQLLENLIYLSVEQEQLLTKTKKLGRYDTKHVEHAQKQKKLKDDAKMIEDSLFALSKRQPSLASYINKEVHQITFNQQKSLDLLNNGESNYAAVNQQYVMTSANNLALILDESIQNMQNSMMKNKFGTGSCNKPGGAKPKPGSGMKKLQDMLSKQLEQMKKALKKQGSKPGKDGKKGKKGAAKSFGKMAAEQNSIKEHLKKLSEQLKNQGSDGLGQAKQMENQLDEIEKELLSKQITPESIRRQEEILTKLLESEKAIKERDFEEKRISKSGKNALKRNPTEFLEYNKTKEGDEEMLKIILPSLKIFYKKKVNEYFNAVEK